LILDDTDIVKLTAEDKQYLE
jgi:Leucine-rich repeat (LRR) protein